MPAADASSRYALHDLRTIRVLFRQVKLFFVGRIDFEEWLVLLLLVPEPRLFELHDALLSRILSVVLP